MSIVSSSSTLSVEALQPHNPSILLSYSGTDDQTALVGQQVSEVDLVKDLDRESFVRLYPPLLFYSLDLTSTEVDSLYRETRAPVFSNPVPIPIFVQLDPPKKMLKRFGLEAEQQAIGLISNGWLERHASELQIKTGDRIGYYDQSYQGTFSRPGGLPDGVATHEPNPRTPNYSFEVLTSKFVDYFANTQIPIHRLVTLKNLRAPGKPDTNVTSR